ncbi:Oxidoreductase, molybdopterin-binding domain-containing protein [Peziza echinospora]|nr:Oxidoreductase, molybdopterin-binding domain-containing protein [Peziza echinospora]
MLLEYSVETPLNREPPPDELISSFITKSSVAYDRNHGPLPHIDEETHYVRVDGAVDKIVELSIKDLRENYEQVEVISSLQCAGNRRHTMRTEFKEVNGIDWYTGAVMNGRWRGPLLRDVLVGAGLAIEGAAHVAFSCTKTLVQDDWYYGGSIDLERCLDKDKFVILALELNGKPLSVNHGFPVRVVIPGVAGARWVKWLDRITVQRNESNNFYMQQDYKILPPHVTTKEQAMANWHLVPPMQLMPVNSVICVPESGDTVFPNKEGKVLVAGYALPQGDDGPVVKVEISLDRGASWEECEIALEAPTRWSWAVWRTYVDVGRLVAEKEEEGESSRRIWSRCLDLGGNTQVGKGEWNWRGVGYNGYGETKNLVVKLQPAQQERDSKMKKLRELESASSSTSSNSNEEVNEVERLVHGVSGIAIGAA